MGPAVIWTRNQEYGHNFTYKDQKTTNKIMTGPFQPLKILKPSNRFSVKSFGAFAQISKPAFEQGARH